MQDIHLCELCLEVFEPEEERAEGGVRKLKTFKGYFVDLRLHEFRKVRVANYRNGVYEDRYIDFVPFDSPKGKKLLAQMHQEVVQQAQQQLADLEKRLASSFEKVLKRHKHKAVTR